MQQDRHRTGRVPVALYTADQDAAARSRLVSLSRCYADARGWGAAEEASDVSVLTPLDERPGWKTVIDALEQGRVRGVVVGPAEAVAVNQADVSALSARLSERGGFLVVCGSPGRGECVPQGPPRRTFGDHLRRLYLYEVSASPYLRT
ncbi:recombinase family protein [Streptomyces sp. NPDC092296]|uniref:recombinase family protein n=1 Tax=Streptomyces sp. NPDC092296 TaxID=3366012 RepID=UPI0037F2B339